MLDFEWDENKNVSNFKKHGIWFEDSLSAFDDTRAMIVLDPDHSSHSEERWILIGRSSRGPLLVVVHCEVFEDELVRIISARKACNDEESQYGGER